MKVIKTYGKMRLNIKFNFFRFQYVSTIKTIETLWNVIPILETYRQTRRHLIAAMSDYIRLIFIPSIWISEPLIFIYDQHSKQDISYKKDLTVSARQRYTDTAICAYCTTEEL